MTDKANLALERRFPFAKQLVDLITLFDNDPCNVILSY